MAALQLIFAAVSTVAVTAAPHSASADALVPAAGYIPPPDNNYLPPPNNNYLPPPNNNYLPPPNQYLPPPDSKYLPPPTTPHPLYLPPSNEGSTGGVDRGNSGIDGKLTDGGVQSTLPVVTGQLGQDNFGGQTNEGEGVPDINAFIIDAPDLFGGGRQPEVSGQSPGQSAGQSFGQSAVQSVGQSSGQFDDGQYRPGGQYDSGQYNPGQYTTNTGGQSGQYQVVGDDGSYRPDEFPLFPPIEDFEFSYSVKDEASGNDYSLNENNNGGAYRVKLPDGRVQIVQFVIDSRGIYRQRISYVQADGSQ